MANLGSQVLQRLRTNRGAAFAIAIALAVNLILLGAYLWSRGGQTTTVVFNVIGENAAVAVDGRVQSFAVDVAGVPPRGGLILTVDDTEAVPSMPTPRGIAGIIVTDVATGETLFEDDFSDGPDSSWELSPNIRVGDGVIGASGTGQMTLPDRGWRDVQAAVTYKNVQSASIGLRTRADGYGIFATVRPFHWNEDATKWIHIAAGRPGVDGPGVRVELDRSESMRSLAAMLVRPYPFAVMLGIVVVLAAAVIAFFPLESIRDSMSRAPRPPAWAIAAVFAEITFILILYFNFSNREHMPYVPDSVAYLFQARIFASGHLTADPPPVEGAFDFFRPAPFVLTDDSWAAQFPFAHSLALAFGQLVGAPWLIPPVIAGGSAALIFLAGRRVYNTRVGVLAAVMLLTSPFFVMQASNLMSHNTGGFFVLAALAAIVYRERNPLLFGALAGAAFGLLLNTRPLTALALMPPFGVYLLATLLPPESRTVAAKHLGSFLAAGAVMALLFLGYNYVLTGDPFETGYQSTGVTFFERPSVENPGVIPDPGAAGSVGAGGSHDSALGIQNERMQMALLLLVLHGWPAIIGLTFSLLPFALGSRKLEDWFFLACAATATGVWVLYESTGVMYGPRYWYEAMPFLILLAARGADRAADLIATAIAAVRDGDIDAADKPLLAARSVVYGIIAVLVLISVHGWLLGQRTTWDADLVPNRASSMCCILGVDDRIHRLVEERDVHNALILVDPCGNNFVCYGSVFWRNSPGLDGDIVYARDDTAKRQEIIDAYPGRAVFLATYQREGVDEATLVPYLRTP